MPMKTLTYPMVGMHYRPPAGQLIRVLPMNAPLTLVAEPFNEFDSNAIAVHVELAPVINNKAVNDVLAKYDGGNLIVAKSIQLGYLPKEVAKHLRANGFPRQGEISGKFYIPFGSNVPHVRFDLDVG